MVWGSGSQYRDFIYVDDVIEALMLVYSRGMNQGLIQVGSESAVAIKEAATKIVAISGKTIEVVFDEDKPEGDRGRIAVCDRARNILGWQVRTSFEEGLRRTYAWVSAELRKHTE